MRRLREAERRKRPEGWRNKTWMLHHDKAPAHTSLLVHEFLAKHEMTVIPQPPYSPDLGPITSFSLPEFEIHSERSPISDDRRDRRKFATGPLEAVYRRWRRVL
jgi:transposase